MIFFVAVVIGLCWGAGMAMLGEEFHWHPVFTVLAALAGGIFIAVVFLG